MAKLPGVADLGPAPTAAPAMPVASYDTSAYASGAQALAQGQEALGSGIEKAGEGGEQLALDKAHWDFAKANSWFHTSRIDLDSATANDTNYGPDASGKTLPERYQASLNGLRDQASAMIGTGPMRELFATRIAPTIAEANARMVTHAKGLETDANNAWAGEQGVNQMNKGVDALDDQTKNLMIKAHDALIDSLSISQEQKFAAKQKWVIQFATADGMHRGDTDPQGALNELRAKPGSDEALAERIIHQESGGNPFARSSTSSAFGVAQFLETKPGGDHTWADLLKQYHPELTQGKSLAEINALRADPNLSREMLLHIIQTNRGILQRNGLDATPGSLYLTHFLGPAGAVAVLKADPGTPVADALVKAVGPGMAGKMIDANQSVLAGKLAGTVTQWANGKMGGVSPGGGSIYDFLPADVRERLEQHLQEKLQQKKAGGNVEFTNSLRDDYAEADRTGVVQNPKSLQDFIAAKGPEQGPAEFSAYNADLATYRTRREIAAMDPKQIESEIEKAEPEPGAGYRAQSARQDMLIAARDRRNLDLNKDPAAYALKNLPLVAQSKAAFDQARADPTATPQARQAAARDYAAKTSTEQQRLGVPPENVRIATKPYIASFGAEIDKAANADDPQARTSLVGRIHNEAQMWGDSWPKIMQEMGPTVSPVARAIGAGADPLATTRLLSMKKSDDPAALLKQQSAVTSKQLTDGVNDAFKTYLGTVLPEQRADNYTPYLNLAHKLAASYVLDGEAPDVAAKKAFDGLVGGRYDFRDNWRIPKNVGVSADDVQAGTLVARGDIASGAIKIEPPGDDMPGRSSAAATDTRLLAKNAAFVTAADQSGLNMTVKGKFVLAPDGKRLVLPWAQLSGLAKRQAGEMAAAHAVEPVR